MWPLLSADTLEYILNLKILFLNTLYVLNYLYFPEQTWTVIPFKFSINWIVLPWLVTAFHVRINFGCNATCWKFKAGAGGVIREMFSYVLK